jgi:phenylacetate-CoA ligase
MHFIMDRKAEWLTNAFNARCRGWYGVKLGDKRAFLTATLEDYSNWHWRKRLAAKINRHRYLNVRTMTESKMQRFAEMLVKWQPDMIRAYPSSLAVFAHYLKERNITGITPKLVEVTAEKVTLPQRQLFEEVFHAPVTDHYASLEIFSYAYQCPDGGLHVNEDRYLELVENGQAVNPGRMGEVVVTALNQYAMPFIRYKNGDVAIYETDGCSCGRGLPVLREVVGRNCDLLVHPDGYVVHYVAITLIVRQWKAVRQFQIYQPDRENLEVRLVCNGKVGTIDLENIRNEIQPFFGESMHISVELVDHIKLTDGGKYRHVISEVKPDFM